MNVDAIGLSSWRTEKLADIDGSDVRRATDSLLELTYEDPDRVGLEKTLLRCLGQEFDPQVRALAVTCLGHVGRLHGEISQGVVSRLRGLLDDEGLGPRAEDALGDIMAFHKDGE